MKQIAIAVGRTNAKRLTKRRQVKASVIGSFAIFEDGMAWNITHKPTGRKLFNCPTEEDARKAVAFMQDGMDWSWGTFGVMATNRPEHYRRAKQAFEQFGL